MAIVRFFSVWTPYLPPNRYANLFKKRIEKCNDLKTSNNFQVQFV